MFKRFVLSAALLFCAAACCVAAPAKKGQTVFPIKLAGGKYRMIAKTNSPGALAKIGDEVKISIKVESELPGFASSQLFVNGIAQGKARIAEFGKEEEFTVVAETPGAVSVICTILDADKKPERKRGGLGVLVSPKKIVPGNAKCPEDFDAFWKERRAELDQVPVKAVRKEVKGNKKFPGVVCYDVQVDCAGGAPVSGYLCMPRDAKPKSLPAIVVYHGAGVRSANKQFLYGTKAIAFDVNAHGLPNGKSNKFYSDLASGELKSYRLRNIDDHRKTYFVGMYTRVMRALDYVKSLPEWDGKTLIVRGGSQGGGQSLAAAALDPQVTFCSASIPALCDLGGGLLKRRPGWPIVLMARRSEAGLVRETAYIDGVFFAQRIKCPVCMSTGLVDNTCHAAAVFATYNSLPKGTDKQILVHPTGFHGPTSPCSQGERRIRQILGIK